MKSNRPNYFFFDSFFFASFFSIFFDSFFFTIVSFSGVQKWKGPLGAIPAGLFDDRLRGSGRIPKLSTNLARIVSTCQVGHVGPILRLYRRTPSLREVERNATGEPFLL